MLITLNTNPNEARNEEKERGNLMVENGSERFLIFQASHLVKKLQFLSLLGVVYILLK